MIGSKRWTTPRPHPSGNPDLVVYRNPPMIQAIPYFIVMFLFNVLLGILGLYTFVGWLGFCAFPIVYNVLAYVAIEHARRERRAEEARYHRHIRAMELELDVWWRDEFVPLPALQPVPRRPSRSLADIQVAVGMPYVRAWNGLVNFLSADSERRYRANGPTVPTPLDLTEVRPPQEPSTVKPAPCPHMHVGHFMGPDGGYQFTVCGDCGKKVPLHGNPYPSDPGFANKRA